MKKVTFIILLVLVSISCKTPKYANLSDGVYAEINTNKGNIFLELYLENTPMTVANFVSLAEGSNTKVTDSLKGKPYFNGVKFHRVIPNFMIQTGDPTGKGNGNPGYRFGDEFPKDKNGSLLYSHNDKGILSMANAGIATNGSQFFITHKQTLHLDGKHTVFGKTTVNSLQQKELGELFKDSLALKKAIDSTRMLVVNKIKQNDTIHAIEIIRIGKTAKSFKAGDIFNEEFVNYENVIRDRKSQEANNEKARYAKYLEDKNTFSLKMNKQKATKTSSGLRILKLKETQGEKVVVHKPTTINYALYIANGQKIESTFTENGKSLTLQLNDSKKQMIAGFKEGILQMKEGERARLFIPYYIGYGVEKFGPFPAKADLIFEIEILKVGT